MLVLEPGITAVVGPNGSGKSNLADAVRWALGEQNKSRLRLSGREEVVFAGTEKRARASFAEVVLLFDNEDGAFPLDLTEVEISRRLYRNGETDYRLAGRSVALRDIQALLAQTGFGAGTYAVIGQGMIDSFLMSSPAERKLLFDEAAGIRGPELGRESALRKLAATEANLVRLRDILAELEPRLKSLERAVAGAHEQQKLAAQVDQLRSAVARTAAAHWMGSLHAATSRLSQLAADTHRLRHERAHFEYQLAALERQSARRAAQRAHLQQALGKLEQERDQLAQKLGHQRLQSTQARQIAASLPVCSAKLRDALTELTTAKAYQAELEAELASNAAAAKRAARTVEKAAEEVARAQALLVEIRNDLSDGARDQYISHALSIIKTLAATLDDNATPPEQIRLLVHKAGRLLSHATRSGADELLKNLKTAQKQLEAAMTKREVAAEHQTNITITIRSLEIDLNHQRDILQALAGRVTALEADVARAKQASDELVSLEAEAAATSQQLETATAKLDAQREGLHHLMASAEDASRQTHLGASLERVKSALAANILEQAGLGHELTEAKTQLKSAHDQAKKWGIALDHRHDDAEISFISLTELQNQLLRAEAMLEAKTSAHRDQAAEYEEVLGRHTELTTQIADLEAAYADLQKVIAQLDDLIRERFKTNFQALAEQFSTYFTRLFGGGSASLELTETEDGAYGINIKASPKGKRLTAIAALSGGERAMAGVALLAAILRVNPSPFVVLDEIDAALDEANSSRLAAILDELQEHSQLIVITHNRQTMRSARVLFGVTMNEHHVSHLLSMRLEDATALAAR